ncbi:SRPBCC family protein [Paenibacillus chartarius]|uniref:SRPBCC family protein n=1 Tax=Paenibacillus chartarius TaxID=747481 RepID=A0ABV6DSS9_9BACL
MQNSTEYFGRSRAGTAGIRKKKSKYLEKRVESGWRGTKLITVKVVTNISAPIDVVFDLARDIDVHSQTVWKHTKERAVAGTTSGLIELGESVTFEATHFGVRQRLTSRIIRMERPHVFVDQMQRGAFKSMMHIHEFAESEGGTVMTDVLRFEAPLGWLGRLAERWVLKDYMRRFLEDRNRELKALAEMQG